jgi:hypothetical protein
VERLNNEKIRFESIKKIRVEYFEKARFTDKLFEHEFMLYEKNRQLKINEESKRYIKLEDKVSRFISNSGELLMRVIFIRKKLMLDLIAHEILYNYDIAMLQNIVTNKEHERAMLLRQIFGPFEHSSFNSN